MGSVTLTVQPHHLQGAGNVHGGLIAALVDTSSFRAVRSTLSPGQQTTTVELKVNFLEATSSGRLTSTARIVSRSDRLRIVEAEVSSEDGRLVAQGLGTFMVIGD